MSYLKVFCVTLLLICCITSVFASTNFSDKQEEVGVVNSSDEQEEVGVVGQWVLFVMSLVFGAIFWILYHKCFDVVYWGSGCMGVIKEWVVCYILGMIPAFIIYKVGLVLLKWVLIIGAIIFVIGLIVAIIGKVSDKKN